MSSFLLLDHTGVTESPAINWHRTTRAVPLHGTRAKCLRISEPSITPPSECRHRPFYTEPAGREKSAPLRTRFLGLSTMAGAQ